MASIWSRLFRRSPAVRVDAIEPKREPRADDFLNAVTGFGTERDKRTAATFVCEPVSDSEARDLWRGDWLVRRLIETLPREEVRQGYVIKTEDKETSEEISDYIDTLGINRAFVRAKMYERAYGGAAIWPVLNDSTGDLAKPLNEERISTIRYLQVFEPRELQPMKWYTDPLDPKYGRPETFRVIAINGGGGGMMLNTEIHESRMVIFQGCRVSRELPAGVTWGWGDCVLTRVRSELRDYQVTRGSIAALMTDFSQGVYKMKGLAELLAADRDDLVKARLAVMDFARSVMKSIVIDGDDDFERKSTPMSGAAEALDKFALTVAGAFDMPLTMLMGSSPGGLNATGDSDIRGWYATVGAEQEQDRPLLEQLVRFCLLAIDGPTGGQEPDVWSIEFNPLWAPSAQESAQTRLTVQQADDLAIASQMVTPEEVAKSRWGGDSYSPDMHIDWDEREKQAKAGEAAIAAGEVAAAAENAQVAAGGLRRAAGRDPAAPKTDPNEEPAPEDTAARADYSPDQERDASGRFGAGGGASGGGGKDKSSAKVSPAAINEFAVAVTALDMENPMLAMGLMGQPFEWEGIRETLNVTMSEMGLTRAEQAKSLKTNIDISLPSNVGGATSNSGEMLIHPLTAEKAVFFAQSYAEDPAGVRAQMSKLKEDKLHSAVNGMSVLVHEAIHTHGPLRSEEFRGMGLAVEEMTTEVSARAYMRENFGYDNTAAYKKLGGGVKALQALGDDGPAYQPIVEVTTGVISKELKISSARAERVLTDASLGFKRMKRDEYEKLISEPQETIHGTKLAELQSTARARTKATGILSRLGVPAEELPATDPSIGLVHVFAQHLAAKTERHPAEALAHQILVAGKKKSTKAARIKLRDTLMQSWENVPR